MYSFAEQQTKMGKYKCMEEIQALQQKYFPVDPANPPSTLADKVQHFQKALGRAALRDPKTVSLFQTLDKEHFTVKKDNQRLSILDAGLDSLNKDNQKQGHRQVLSDTPTVDAILERFNHDNKSVLMQQAMPKLSDHAKMNDITRNLINLNDAVPRDQLEAQQKRLAQQVSSPTPLTQGPETARQEAQQIMSSMGVSSAKWGDDHSRAWGLLLAAAAAAPQDPATAESFDTFYAWSDDVAKNPGQLERADLKKRENEDRNLQAGSLYGESGPDLGM